MTTLPTLSSTTSDQIHNSTAQGSSFFIHLVSGRAVKGIYLQGSGEGGQIEIYLVIVKVPGAEFVFHGWGC